MLDFPRWKRLTIFIGLAIMVALAIPSFFPQSAREKWPRWVPKPAINLGLDLAGGSYLLLEGDTSSVAKDRLAAMSEQIRGDMRRDPRIEIGDISVQGGKVTFMVRDPSTVEAGREKLLPHTKAWARPASATGTSRSSIRPSSC
jgi:preprotein translocase subunit SecD